MDNEKIQSFQILEQHIVSYQSNLQILFLCKGDKYFITSYGDMFYIKSITEFEALKLIA